jgi:GT2 family glycosyltransferase
MISAIIVNYHSAHSTVRAVSSLFSPEQQEEVDIWVVDNSESEEEARFLKTELNDTCHLLVNSKNVGFGAACNQVFERTRGDWILLLNPDAYLEEGALKALRSFMEKHPRVGAAGPLIYWDKGHNFLLPPSPSPSPWRELLTFPSNSLRARLTWLNSLWWRYQSLRVWQAAGPKRQHNLSGGHVLLRRTAVNRAGGLFDTRFFLYYEDTDLFLRIRRAGFDLFVVPEAVVVHQFSGCARYKEQWKREEMAKSGILFMEKHYGNHMAYRLAQRQQAGPGPTQSIPVITDLGIPQSPPVFSIPNKWYSGWLLEWSPNPFMFPAAGYPSKGNEAIFPQEVWSILPQGKQFVRLGSSRNFLLPLKIWQWEKE